MAAAPSSQSFPYSSSSTAASSSNPPRDKMPDSIPRIGTFIASQNEPEPPTTNRSRSASGSLILDVPFESLDVGQVRSQASSRIEESTQTEALDKLTEQSRHSKSQVFDLQGKDLLATMTDAQNKENIVAQSTAAQSSPETPRKAAPTSDITSVSNRFDPRQSVPITAEQDVLAHQAENLHSINQQTKLIVPPLNFDLVNAGLYRSGHPNERNFDFMKGLSLNGVVYLAQETYLPSVKEWAIREGVKVHHFGLNVNKEPFAEMEANKVVALLEILLDSRNHPLLIHCNKGKYRVGCIVALIRRLQNWSHTSLFEEFERFAGGRGRGADLEFIETFDLGRVKINSTHKPAWL